MSNPYESPAQVAEYLFFHYASGDEVAGGLPIPREALDFPVRLVTELADFSLHPQRALDLGCAVGRSAFELSRHVPEVLGVDFSGAFIDAAEALRAKGELSFSVPVEGEITESFTARLPEGVEPGRLAFERGDATALRSDIGTFDLVLAANLLCRVPDPAKFVERLPRLVEPGGQLLLATPFSWLPQYTPRERWIGGRAGGPRSWEELRKLLEPHFELKVSCDLPFLIREHSRKFQYGISRGSRWIRRA